MFVTGEWAQTNPALVQRMASEGHLVANHTYSHPDLRTVSDEAVLNELARTDAAISALTKRTTKPFVRPPYGAQDARVNRLFGNAGFRYDVLWTVDSFGWNGLTWQQVVKRCLDRSAPGTIYMFHLGAQADLDALPWIVQWHLDNGYTIVRLDAWYS
jgi:peptidoglycan/xylan/chitin deacetylase (PgdA/CDA1 family)